MKADSKSYLYNINRELFEQIQTTLSSYRVQNRIKQIKCIETGKIFKNALYARNWLITNNITTKISSHISVLNACKGKIESAFGYHWQYITEDD